MSTLFYFHPHALLKKGLLLKGKNVFALGTLYFISFKFSVKIKRFSEGDWCVKKQREVLKVDAFENI